MEASFKQLRIRFTAMTGLLSGILLLLLLVILCVSIYASAELTSVNVLDAILEHPNQTVVDDMGRRCFAFICSASHSGGETQYYYQVMDVYADQWAAYGDSQSDIIAAAVGEGNGEFEVDGLYFRVSSRYITENTALYAVIDRTSDRQTLTLVATIIVLIYVTSLIVAILFFYIYSSYALAPVEESFKKQRDLIANASHELKTPLTVISTNLAVMKSEPHSTVEENAKWMDAIDAQIKRMNGLIVNMLQLSKMENAVVNLTDTDFSELTEGACLGFDAVCFEKGLRLITEITPDVHVMGDRDALERLVTGLLDNATKYCNANGKIGLKLTADGKRAHLYVMNTGEAVSDEDAKHVFDRFYRSDGARSNPDGNSFGLGLAIARATAQAHGGTIVCRGIKDKGTVFEVTIPLSKGSGKKYKHRPDPAVSDSATEMPAEHDSYFAETQEEDSDANIFLPPGADDKKED